MMDELDRIASKCRAVERSLSALHERAAVVRDVAEPHSKAKAKARRIANCIEGALQRLERIE